MVARPFAIGLPRLLARAVESALGLALLERLYERRRHGDFVEEALRLLQIGVECCGAIGAIPATGAAIVVANHPTGGADGLALLQAVTRRRPDVKVLANELLSRVPELQDRVIGVNTLTSTGREHVRALREARRWLLHGGVLIVFPAGEVSHVARADGALVDSAWRRGVLTLIDWTDAAVVPAFVDARTTAWFRLLGRLHPWLRTALLARELIAQRGRCLRVCFGTSVTAERLRELPDAAARLAYLRARTYALEHDDVRHAKETHGEEAVAPPELPEALEAELHALPQNALLLRSGHYDVFCATAATIPAALREIGRLRELTFRLVGEGTGRARDLDEFDETYRHLFVWDREARCIVGAYRLGFTDRLRATAKPRVLYTRALFTFDAELLRELDPAIELGRSFVRAEYQRTSNALLLLWRGIGAVVAREPRYRYLFGAVSISSHYRSLTREVLARLLVNHRFASRLSSLVRPSRPMPAGSDAQALVRSQVATSLDDVERLVTELEDGRGLPVLVRQYLMLNARILGFSVDPGFGNVLDGLVLVDLLDVRPALLHRYLGRDHAAAFLSYHEAERARAVDALTHPSPAHPLPVPLPGSLSPVSMH
jgi:putative hemolysin